jgi:hypothetical protein
MCANYKVFELLLLQWFDAQAVAACFCWIDEHLAGCSLILLFHVVVLVNGYFF